jgi:hypothetical protein
MSNNLAEAQVWYYQDFELVVTAGFDAQLNQEHWSSPTTGVILHISHPSTITVLNKSET